MPQEWRRCWINEDGKVEWFRENERAPRGIKWKSVHLFSRPLSSLDVENVLVRGPLMLSSEQRFAPGGHHVEYFRRKLRAFLFDYGLPVDVLRYFYVEHDCYFVEVVGHNSDDEMALTEVTEFQREYEPDSLPECFRYIDICDQRFLFFDVTCGHCEISEEFFWGASKDVDTAKAGADHYAYNMLPCPNSSESNHSLLFNCALVRNAFLNLGRLSVEEREVLFLLCWGTNFEKGILKPDARQKTFKILKKKKTHSFDLVISTSCKKLIGSGLGKYCRGCAETVWSPRGLIGGTFEAGEYLLRSDQLYQRHNGKDLLLSYCPIMMHARFESELKGDFLGCELLVLFSEGNIKLLRLSADEFYSSALFEYLLRLGIKLPPSRTARGMLRNFLESQQPLGIQKFVGQGGWQQDGAFGVLGRIPRYSFLRPVSSSAALENISWQWRDSVGRGKDIESGLEAFIKIIAATAPLLKKLNLSGVGIHFYGGNQRERDEIARVASTLWDYSCGGCGYSIDEASSNVQELKRVYQDQPICVVNVSPDKIKKYRSFLKRFLMGRKGVDSSTCGCIISVGSDSIATRVNQQHNRMYYEQNGKILALCFDISLFDELKWRQRVDFQVEEVLQRVFELKDAKRKLKFVDRDFLFGKKNCLPKAVKKMFCAFALTSTDVCLLGNQARSLELIETVALKWERQVNDDWKYLYDNLPRLLSDTRSYRVQHNRGKCLFFPSKGYKEALGLDQGKLASFSQYLISKRVLMADSEGCATQVRYVRELGKSVRGYLLKKNIFRT